MLVVGCERGELSQHRVERHRLLASGEEERPLHPQGDRNDDAEGTQTDRGGPKQIGVDLSGAGDKGLSTAATISSTPRGVKTLAAGVR